MRELVIVRCESCSRPFGSYAKRCPTCGWRSIYWFQSLLVRLVAIAAAVIAAVVVYKTAHKHSQLDRPPHEVTPMPDRMAMPRQK